MRLRNMPPRGAAHDLPDRPFLHAKPARQITLKVVASRVHGADQPHIGGSQFGYSVALPKSLAAFRDHVMSIVCIRAKKQMIRSYTGRVVATMADDHAVGNWAVGKFPSNAMSVHRALVESNAPVPFVIAATLPLPAAIPLLRLRPESRGESFRRRGIAHTLRHPRAARPRAEAVTARARYARGELVATVGTDNDVRSGSLRGHGSHNLSCHAGGVTSAARLIHALNFTIYKPKPIEARL